MKRLVILLLTCGLLGSFCTARLNAQSTNQGTDFYLGFSQNYAGAANLALYITGTAATTGTVTIANVSFSANFTVTPGTITTITIPSAAESTGSDTFANNGIHVTAALPVTVYGLSSITATTDAYLGLPLTALGSSYIVFGYNGGLGGPSEFQVVGTQDATQVTITPSVAATNHAAGVPYTIPLNQLQTYQLQASGPATDLTGTLITSTKPIALFGGAVCTNIPNNNYTACDYVVEQIPATATWGMNYLVVPLSTRKNGDTVRVLARDAGTTVTIDGSLVTTLGAAQVYQTLLADTSNHTIVTSKPSLVAQYSNSTSYDNVLSDPMMMLISPTEQFQTSYSVATPTNALETYTNYINVVAKASDINACKVDNNPITTFTAIGVSGYDGAQIPVATGTHNLSCPNPFGTYSYGFAYYDSYGYPGGLGVKGISAPRCDVNKDGRIDSTDISLIFAARNTPATGVDDPRDGDGDGTITVADARTCSQLCTIAGCATH
jgi:hypothetical protein